LETKEKGNTHVINDEETVDVDKAVLAQGRTNPEGVETHTQESLGAGSKLYLSEGNTAKEGRGGLWKKESTIEKKYGAKSGNCKKPFFGKGRENDGKKRGGGDKRGHSCNGKGILNTVGRRGVARNSHCG